MDLCKYRVGRQAVIRKRNAPTQPAIEDHASICRRVIVGERTGAARPLIVA